MLEPPPYAKLATLRDIGAFRGCAASTGVELPCDDALDSGSGLGAPLQAAGVTLRNRFAIQPMEGWDGEPDGAPSDRTLRRWRRFGSSGAGLIWGGEAVAVSPEGRANPHQLLLNERTIGRIARLRVALCDEHRSATGGAEPPLIGLQLTHSGRYCRPHGKDRPEPIIAFRHPVLDVRIGLPPDFPVVTDSQLRALIEQYGVAARLAAAAGFDFVDVKHCHGYLAHELLAGHTRHGDYGGSLYNRTRFLREVVQTIHAAAPGLRIGVRLSAFDTVPFHAHPQRTSEGRPGPGVPEFRTGLVPYRWGFGVDASDPTRCDLTETYEFVSALQGMGIRLLNVTGGSPYYNPHIQRPALYPPSDGYMPPEDPLQGVARHMRVCRDLKRRFPEMLIVGSGISYLQEFLPYVAQAAVRAGWMDCAGLGRMVLAYPEMPRDVLAGVSPPRKRVCRTFSDCTTAPREGLPSGCYPLDAHFKESEEGARLRALKRSLRL